jgi:cytoskeletal protein CcmA (bactofilin family)
VKEDLRVHELLIVRASSTITGNIFYKEIDIERGAKISGQLSMI